MKFQCKMRFHPTAYAVGFPAQIIVTGANVSSLPYSLSLSNSFSSSIPSNELITLTSTNWNSVCCIRHDDDVSVHAFIVYTPACSTPPFMASFKIV